MLNLKRFSKVSSGAKFQFGQSALAHKNTLGYRFVHANSSSSGKSNVGKYALGSLIFGFSTIVVYAKYDTKFRQWLKTNVYGSDELLKLLLFEDKSIHNKPNSEKPKLVPPTNNHDISVKSTPSKLQTKESQTISAETDKPIDKELTGKNKILGKNTEKETSDFRRIRSEATIIVKEVSNSYSEALDALKNYYELVNGTVNDVSHKHSSSFLKKLQKVSLEKDELFQTAKVNAQEARKRLDQMQYSLDESKHDVTNEEKETIINNIMKLKTEIKTLEKNFLNEKDDLLLFNKYNGQVINIRKRFSEELQSLFPHVRLDDKNMKLTDAEFDVFVDYITQKLLFYQNELFKQQIFGEEQVNDVVHALKNGNPEAIDKVLGFQVEKNRRRHMNNFINESFGSKANSEAKFKEQLRFQTEVHMDHLKEAANLAEKEVERRVNLEYSEKSETEKLKYKEQVLSMIAVMNGINDAVKEHSKKRDKLNESFYLWTACQSLSAAIDTDQNDSKHELIPLQELVNNIKKSGGENHVIIKELLDTIPERVLTRGVYSEETLKDRFLNVEDKAFHMALVPDTNVKLFDLITSFVFTIFTFKSSIPITEEEFNEPINVNELNNIDILQRARYWVERDNYYRALQYMHLLKGGAKIIASDWMSETRDYLATQQAAQTLLAYASESLRSHVDVSNTSI
ncbi:MICOS complex subunit Mic60 isoform X1 [Acyrthosiphon pisum]|uniref:MICOS complex subunit MIC60 n=1 Tax=Acyrthosiphon pisum TaxID=7029 RepID=A0A8R1W6R2_ACYPI|nr:MICOS complex subunit Mic60 isoform X1 [Acyrthosiphon pisum]|eukprot:XP_003240956.1 PREDICTED: MICOS complex subunit Mic60 isoform X1 [Acyrthosiphon pisum]